MLRGKIIKETIVLDHLLDYFFYLVYWRAMCLRLPKAKMPKNFCDRFQLINDRNYSHKVRTPGTAKGVHLVYLLDEGGPRFPARFFGRNAICDNVFTFFRLF